MSLLRATPLELWSAVCSAQQRQRRGEPLDWQDWQALGLYGRMRRYHLDLARTCGTEREQQRKLAKAARQRGKLWL